MMVALWIAIGVLIGATLGWWLGYDIGRWREYERAWQESQQNRVMLGLWENEAQARSALEAHLELTRRVNEGLALADEDSVFGEDR